MKKLRDKIVDDLIDEVEAPAPARRFDKGLVAGIALGAVMAFGALYMGGVEQKNAVESTALHSTTEAKAVPTSAQSGNGMRVIDVPDDPNDPSLILPPPFEKVYPQDKQNGMSI